MQCCFIQKMAFFFAQPAATGLKRIFKPNKAHSILQLEGIMHDVLLSISLFHIVFTMVIRSYCIVVSSIFLFSYHGQEEKLLYLAAPSTCR